MDNEDFVAMATYQCDLANTQVEAASKFAKLQSDLMCELTSQILFTIGAWAVFLSVLIVLCTCFILGKLA